MNPNHAVQDSPHLEFAHVAMNKRTTPIIGVSCFRAPPKWWFVFRLASLQSQPNGGYPQKNKKTHI